MVYQNLSLVGDLTVWQNIVLGKERRKGIFLNDRAARDLSRSILESLLPGMDIERMVFDLSPGEMQIVEIAKAIASEPKLLILDEPTSALEKAEVKSLMRYMRKLADSGVAITFTSHRLPGGDGDLRRRDGLSQRRERRRHRFRRGRQTPGPARPAHHGHVEQGKIRQDVHFLPMRGEPLHRPGSFLGRRSPGYLHRPQARGDPRHRRTRGPGPAGTAACACGRLSGRELRGRGQPPSRAPHQSQKRDSGEHPPRARRP